MSMESNELSTASGSTTRLWWPATIVLTVIAVALATLLHSGAPLLPVSAFLFLLVCPGMAFVPLLPIHDRLIQIGLAVVLSIGLDGVTSEAMVYAKVWSYQGEIVLLAGICLLGVMLQLREMVPRVDDRTGISEPYRD